MAWEGDDDGDVAIPGLHLAGESEFQLGVQGHFVGFFGARGREATVAPPGQPPEPLEDGFLLGIAPGTWTFRLGEAIGLGLGASAPFVGTLPPPAQTIYLQGAIVPTFGLAP